MHGLDQPRIAHSFRFSSKDLGRKFEVPSPLCMGRVSLYSVPGSPPSSDETSGG
jgi:hypothetical protein